MQDHREQVIRIGKNGAVSFVHDSLDTSAQIDSYLAKTPVGSKKYKGFPSVASNYGSYIADRTRAERPGTTLRPDIKSYVSFWRTVISDILATKFYNFFFSRPSSFLKDPIFCNSSSLLILNQFHHGSYLTL